MSDKLVKMLSTWFYVGNIRGAPGTLASAVGAIMAVLLSFNTILYIMVFGIVTAIGYMVCGKMEAILDKKDPGCIVIDEVAGVMIAFFLMPLRWDVIITAFFLFRAFDMFKIYPVNKFERFEGSQGIMADDLFAGLYTNIVMQFAIRWAGMI